MFFAGGVGTKTQTKPLAPSSSMIRPGKGFRRHCIVYSAVCAPRYQRSFLSRLCHLKTAGSRLSATCSNSGKLGRGSTSQGNKIRERAILWLVPTPWAICQSPGFGLEQSPTVALCLVRGQHSNRKRAETCSFSGAHYVLPSLLRHRLQRIHCGRILWGKVGESKRAGTGPGTGMVMRRADGRSKRLS